MATTAEQRERMQEVVRDHRMLELSASGVILAKNVAEVLHKTYPGHLWAVTVDEDGGVLVVKNLYLSGDWGYVRHLNKLPNGGEALKKLIIRDAGELLERYNLSRGGVRIDEIADLKRDVRGIPLCDRS